MSDLEDTNEGQDTPQDEESQEQPTRPLPEIRGISREERGRKFEEWVKHYSLPNEKRLVDPSRLFYSERRHGEVVRIYHEPNPASQFSETAMLHINENGSVNIQRGHKSREGRQDLNYNVSTSELHMESAENANEILVTLTYDIEGRIRSAMMADWKGGFIVGAETANFDEDGNSTTQLYDTGSPRISPNQNPAFINLIKEHRGDTITYKVPKSVNIRNSMEKLVPQSLVENPFGAPTSQDRWYHTDILGAFGIEKEVEGLPYELSSQGDDDSQGHHGREEG